MSEERKLIANIIYELNVEPDDVDDIVDDIYSIIRTQDRKGVVDAVRNLNTAFSDPIEAIESYYGGVSDE